MEGSISLLADTLKLALVKNSYIYDINHEFFSSVGASEIVDSGYTHGGTALSNKAVNQEVNKIYFDADDLAWTIAGTVSIKYALLYKDTGIAATSPLITVFEFDPERVVVNSTITFKVNNKGFLELQ